MKKKHRRSPSEQLKQTLASNIRSYRKNRKLSQEELAAICDLHRTYVGSVERGERNVTLGTLEALSSALGVSVAAMLSEGGIADED
jgi:transcriptional regulator with XRE-family HTH domain